MSETEFFPQWILVAINKNPGQLNPKSKVFFEKMLELSPHFNNSFLTIPTTSDVGILKTHDQNELHAKFGIDSPNELILLAAFELFHFQATYQIRELGLSLLNALEEGRFYVSAITTRAMLEVVCINYFTFRRVDEKFKKCVGYLHAAAKTKSKSERQKILTKYSQESLEVFSLIFNANTSSSINWSNYMHERFDIKIPESRNSKKIHVNTAIEDMEKKSKLPLISAYSILSEFVHPNAGSKMLVTNTKNSHNPLMDSLRIGDNKSNPEAVLFYFDHISEATYYTWTLALTVFHRGQDLLVALDHLVPVANSRQVH